MRSAKPANHLIIKFKRISNSQIENQRKAVATVVLTKSSPTPVRYPYSPYKPHLHSLHLTQNVNKYFLTCVNKEETSFSSVFVDFSDLVREFLY